MGAIRDSEVEAPTGGPQWTRLLSHGAQRGSSAPLHG